MYVNVSKIKDFNAEKIKDIDINDHRIDLRDLWSCEIIKARKKVMINACLKYFILFHLFQNKLNLRVLNLGGRLIGLRT